MPIRSRAAIIGLLLGVIAAASVSRAAKAQGGYARARTDTLHYREVTNAEIRITSPQGMITVTSEQDSQIALTFGGLDSARAWYESLLLAATSPQGTQTPRTDSLLMQPFLLSFTARGAVSLRRAPIMPASVAAVTDLTHQFDDFFLRLPSGALTTGRTWRDTSVIGDSTGPTWYHARSIARYTVKGDTVFNGERALVIGMTQELTLTSGGPVPNQPVTSSQTLEGSDAGTVIYSPTRGRMLARQRLGALSGAMTFTAPSGTTTMPQRYGFDSRIDLLP